jgi:hypothetical protein
MSKIGRPTKYNKLLGDKFCELLSTGVSIEQIVSKNQDMPTWRTIYRWKIKYPEFRQEYVRAQKAFWEYKASEAISIATTPLPTQETTKNIQTGTTTKILDNVNRSRLIIDTIKWFLSKKLPKD